MVRPAACASRCCSSLAAASQRWRWQLVLRPAERAGPGCARSALTPLPQIHFLLLFSKQGKVRLSKYYSTFNQKERNKVRPFASPRAPSSRSPDCAGRHHAGAGARPQDVQLRGVARVQACVPALRVALLLRRLRPGRQRAAGAGSHPHVRGDPGPLLWQRVRAGCVAWPGRRSS